MLPVGIAFRAACEQEGRLAMPRYTITGEPKYDSVEEIQTRFRSSEQETATTSVPEYGMTRATIAATVLATVIALLLSGGIALFGTEVMRRGRKRLHDQTTRPS
jgi:hypothetical protein